MGYSSVIGLLARRFLISKRSDAFLSFIAWVSVTGVSLGVLALTVVTSVINGFQGELVRVIDSMNGDVILYSRGEAILNPERIEERIREILPNTQGITRSFVAELMVSGPQAVAGAFLEGIDLKTVAQVTEVTHRVIRGRLPEKEAEIALGSALAERIGATVGTEIRVIAPLIGDGEAGSEGTPRILKAVVTGFVEMGMNDYDSKYAYMRIEDVQKFYDQIDRVTAFKIRLPPHTKTRQASDQLADHFGYPFRAKDWSQLNRNVLYAIQLEKVVITLILTVIVIVAAFNVVSTLMMMIYDKGQEIAILKAMGLRPRQSFGLFCWIGMGIGAIGVLAGIGLGLAVNEILARTKLISLPADIYYIGYLPVVVDWSEIIQMGCVALMIVFCATLYPSWQVSRRSPLEGLRYG